MNYSIELAATAKADLRETTRWIRDSASPDAANRWLDGLLQAVDTLRTQPLRCPLADESDKFPEEIRFLLYGKPRQTYRVLFTIRDQSVVILYIRHTARDELEP